MIEHGVNRLPVVIQDGRVVGIVTRADLVRAFTRQDAEIALEIQKDILERVLWAEPSGDRSLCPRGRGRGRRRARDELGRRDLRAAFVEKVPGVVSLQSRVTYRVRNANGERSGR